MTENKPFFDFLKYQIMIEDKPFFDFLKYQIKGIFNNFHCDHDFSVYSCFICMEKFIKLSGFKDYFEHLYQWFKHVNFQPHDSNQSLHFNSFTRLKKQKLSNNDNHNNDNHNHNNDNTNHNISFYPEDIYECFNSIGNYLTPNEAKYFCSSWLDGMYINFHNLSDIITLENVFEALCYQGKLETLRWFYKSIEPHFRLTKSKQQQIFINMCNQTPQKNTNSYELLSWLFSLKIFEQLNVHVNDEHAFRSVCKHNNTAALKFLLELKGDQEIDVHVREEDAFREACELWHSDIVEILLELKGPREINVHVKNEDALVWACNKGYIKVVKLLLELKEHRKVNVHVMNDHIFRYAIIKQNIEIIMLLLDLKGDQKISSETHKIAFRQACYHGNTEVVKLLLQMVYNQHGDYNVIDFECRNVCKEGLEKAYLSKQLSVIQLLEGLLL